MDDERLRRYLLSALTHAIQQQQIIINLCAPKALLSLGVINSQRAPVGG